MKHTRVLSLGLALCLGGSAFPALAANEPNTQRTPSEQVPGTGTIDRNAGPMGSGTPGDGLGSGTDANDTDNTGGDGTSQPKSGSTGPGTGNSGDLDDSGSPGSAAPRNDDSL